VRAQALVVGLLLVAALTACGEDPTRTVADEAGGTPSATATPSAPVEPAGGAAGGGASAPDDGPAEAPDDPAEEPDDPTEAPDDPDDPASDPDDPDDPAGQPPAAPAAGSGGPDLDGDGRGDSVTLQAVRDMGWSFDVRLADGRETSAPLPDDGVVREDVEVVGAVDLDRDGADEVLVRTLRAVGGQNAVVFRLDGDDVWLVRDHDGAPFELSTSGGMTGPRSWACRDGEVLTRESERQADGSYRATTWRWTVGGHVAGPLGGARDDALSAEEVSLDPSTCDA
jgi:hypothetical protein